MPYTKTIVQFYCDRQIESDRVVEVVETDWSYTYTLRVHTRRVCPCTVAGALVPVKMGCGQPDLGEPGIHACAQHASLLLGRRYPFPPPLPRARCAAC